MDVLVRDFIGPSGLVRVVFGPSCPAPNSAIPLNFCIYQVFMYSARDIAVTVSTKPVTIPSRTLRPSRILVDL